MIPGIGVVTCVYVNPELQRFWVLDFRLFDPERDGRSKINHLLEMFDRVLQSDASSIRVVVKFPKGHQVKLFRLVSSTGDTEWIVTNDLSEASASAVRKQTAVRWKIEQFHRQWKQTTGVQRCQCRKQRAQRNHITASLLAKTTVYALKQGLLDDYLCKQLRNPAFAITSA